MSRLTDRLEQIEHDLAESPDDTASDLLGRRLVLRKALEAYGKERYDEGYHEGMRDALDTGYEARRLAVEKGTDGPEFGVLDEEGRLGDYSGHELWHTALYLPKGCEAEVAQFLAEHGIEVCRMWPVQDPAQCQAAMAELQASLNTGKDGSDGRT